MSAQNATETLWTFVSGVQNGLLQNYITANFQMEKYLDIEVLQMFASDTVSSFRMSDLLFLEMNNNGSELICMIRGWASKTIRFLGSCMKTNNAVPRTILRQRLHRGCCPVFQRWQSICHSGKHVLSSYCWRKRRIKLTPIIASSLRLWKDFTFRLGIRVFPIFSGMTCFIVKTNASKMAQHFPCFLCRTEHLAQSV